MRKKLGKKFGVVFSLTVVVMDTELKLMENVLSNLRAKHIEIRYHYVRDM